MTPLLELKKLSVHYQQNGQIVKAVENVDMTINEGDIIGLVGESGCGKSTLALSILRLIDTPGKIYGEILWGGNNILNIPVQNMQRIRGEEIGMVFQDPFSSLNPVFKVGEQISEVLRVHKGMSKREARQKTIELLKKVHINDAEERINDYPHQFSGGMKQRVAVAMAYALSPRLLIADEPTTALDVTMQKAILELLRELRTTMLFISHNIALVAGLCSRLYIMQSGRIVEEGTPEELIKSPKDPYTSKLVGSYRELNIENN